MAENKNTGEFTEAQKRKYRKEHAKADLEGFYAVNADIFAKKKPVKAKSKAKK